MAWYKAGTISVSGTTVTGTGTNWTDNKMGIGPGQALLIPGAGSVKMYEIARVDSATKITLASDAGAVSAGSAYAIMSSYTDSVPDFARRLSAQLSYYQSQMDGWQKIMTGAGAINIEAPDGTVVAISSFKKLTDDMNGKGAVAASNVWTGNQRFAASYPGIDLFSTSAATSKVGKIIRLEGQAGNQLSILYRSGGDGSSGQVIVNVPTTAGTLALSTSDRRLKNIISETDTDGARQRIDALVPVEYHWNEASGGDADYRARVRRGFIAQDVNAVSEPYAIPPLSEDAFWGIDDRAIIADLVMYVRSLEERIKTLEEGN